MQNKDKLTPGELELEAALLSLTPIQSGAKRDEVMFRSGGASMKRQNRIWRGLSAMMTVLLLMSLIFHDASSLMEVHPGEGDAVKGQPLLSGAANNQGGTQLTRPAPGEVSDEWRVTGAARPGATLCAKAEAYTIRLIRQHVRTRRVLLEEGMDALPAWRVVPSRQRALPLTADRWKYVPSPDGQWPLSL